MIELRCRGCRKPIATRDGDNIVLGLVTAKAPCDVMCNKCGTINNIPAVPPLVPVEPKPAVVSAPIPTPLPIVIDDKGKK